MKATFKNLEYLRTVSLICCMPYLELSMRPVSESDQDFTAAICTLFAVGV